jgi:hypothetical protein
MSDDLPMDEHIEMIHAASDAMEKVGDIHEDMRDKFGIADNGQDFDAHPGDVTAFFDEAMEERLSETEREAMEYLNL